MKSINYTCNKKVSVILVNYKNYNDTIECLKSLDKVNYPNLSIMVVDNNSEDDSFLTLKKYENSKVRVVETGFNGGFASGNNFGIKKALEDKADYILLLNNDTIVDADFLNPLLYIAENDGDVGIVSSRIMVYPDIDRIWYAGGKVDWENLRAIHFGLGEEISEKYLNECTVDFASGCCMLIPADTIKKVGLLPEEYFMYYEDMDYCIKVTDEGFKIKYAPESIIYHCVSSSSGGADSPFVVEWSNRGRRKFYHKYKKRIPSKKRIFIFLKCEMRALMKILLGKKRMKLIKAYIVSFERKA